MENLDNYSNYAYHFIESICNDFGPRITCSDEERQTNLWIQTQLSEFCDETNIEEFTVRPNHFFQGIFKIIFPIGLLAFLFNFLVYPYSIFSSIAIVIFIFFLISDFMLLKGLLGPFFKKGTSSNVYGIIKPKNEVKFRVILDGHTDSAYELPWARIKKLSILAFLGTFTILYILLQLIYPIAKIIKQSFVSDHNVISKWTIFEITRSDLVMLPICFVFMLLFSTLFIGLFSKRKVMGAIDNLSGTSVAVAAGKYFSENKLDNTELVIISTGSEEIGERGAHYFAKNHPELFENAYALVIESVGAGKNLFIVERDYMHMAFYSKEVVTQVKKAYEIYQKEKSDIIPCKSGSLVIGSSNANMYLKEGFRATFVIMQSKDAPWRPTNWHGREDTFDKIDKKVLEDVLGITITFVKLIDDELKNKIT
ncbi:MAG: Zn-dependent exopeptidase M28 [Asgard group archaeon]|nr:Zn-dependent exopeptidase M28 [Asgard group archaeon]